MVTKEEIQQKVMFLGKPIPLEKFDWDDENKIFTAKGEIVSLTIDFSWVEVKEINVWSNNVIRVGDNCKINGWNYNYIKGGSNCTVKVDNYCTVTLGYNSIVETGEGSVIRTSNKIGGGSFNIFKVRGRKVVIQTGNKVILPKAGHTLEIDGRGNAKVIVVAPDIHSVAKIIDYDDIHPYDPPDDDDYDDYE